MVDLGLEKQANPRRRRHKSQSGPTEKEREYLEIIYYLTVRGERVIAAQIARWMGVQPPTVTHVLKEQLGKKKYINRGRQGEISLTPLGREVAEAVVRRHRILECFLLDVLQMPWYLVHEEAVRLEHALSPAMEERIIALVGEAHTCPHGNPIPGASATTHDVTISLNTAESGTLFTIQRVLEEAEENSELLRYLQSNGLLPGHQFAVVDASSTYGVTLRRCNHDITLSPEIASVIRGDVEPISMHF